MVTNLVIKGSENNMSSKNKLKSTLLFAGATIIKPDIQKGKQHLL